MAFLLLSVFFSPLMGSVLIAQNHRAAGEKIWRGVSWFWVVVWAVFLLVAFSLQFAAVPCGPVHYWIMACLGLSAFWFFTCALPHHGFLHARSFDAAWRSDWGKPVGFGFLGWVILFTVFLLSH